jgi:hypothetical protein
MKRRTRPAGPRPDRPSSLPSSMNRYFPGIDSMSDIDGFRALFTLVSLSSPESSDLAHRFLAHFVQSRGLELQLVPGGYRGFDSYRLLKGGSVLASFSASVS